MKFNEDLNFKCRYLNITDINSLAELNIPPENLFSHNFRLLEPYAPYQMRRVQKIIRYLTELDPEHLLVLDDGSYFLEARATMKTNFRRLSIVEKTSRGIFKINENSAMKYQSGKIPVVITFTWKTEQYLQVHHQERLSYHVRISLRWPTGILPAGSLPRIVI